MRSSLLVTAALAALVLVGCTSDDDFDGPGEPEPTLEPPDSATFREFQADCEQEVANWREGQVGYPATMALQLNRATAYHAAVDVRDEPRARDLVLPAVDSADETVFFKCLVGARLVALGQGLVIEADEGADAGWLYQEFSPTGVLRWSWAVTATVPQDQQVRLEMRPAVEGDLLRMPLHHMSFVTDVTVDATAIERASHWFETQWPLLVGITVAACTGILTVRGLVRKIVRRRRTPA